MRTHRLAQYPVPTHVASFAPGGHSVVDRENIPIGDRDDEQQGPARKPDSSETATVGVDADQAVAQAGCGGEGSHLCYLIFASKPPPMAADSQRFYRSGVRQNVRSADMIQART